ncbi:MAG: flagellar brake protein [Burkholderiaceae bacterium]
MAQAAQIAQQDGDERKEEHQQEQQQEQRDDFDAMRLPIGGRLQFITHRDVKPVQHFSSLIGYVRGEYLILKVPFQADAPISVLEGERITIRAFTGTRICSFASVVQRVFGAPYWYAHCAFPDRISGSNLRSAIRVRVEMPVEMRLPGGAPETVRGAFSNVSVNGALFEAEADIDAGTPPVTLSFRMGADGAPVTVKAVVRNKRALVERAAWAYGLEFLVLDATQRLALENLVYERVLQDRQNVV